MATPADAVATLSAVAGPPSVTAVWRAPDGTLQHELTAAEIADRLRDRGGALWVDIDARDVPHCTRVLGDVFHFHPLAIEDTLNPESRVKLEEYDGYLFMIVRGVRFREETPDPYDYETVNLCFFLGPNFLVTVHRDRTPSVDALLDRPKRVGELLGRGVERLFHGIVDHAIDAFFPILDQLDEFVDGLEERVFVSFDRNALRDIFRVKRLVVTLRRQLAPQREVLGVLANRPSPYLKPATQIYFRDVYDHALRINDAIDGYRELLSSTLDSYLTQVSNQLGTVTKTLSLIATITLPFIIVSGMWGMNFARVPLAEAPGGFWIMLVLQLVIGVALVAILKWRRLL